MMGIWAKLKLVKFRRNFSRYSFEKLIRTLAVVQQSERSKIAILDVYLDHKHICKYISNYAIEYPMIELANFKVNFDEVAVAASSKKRDCSWENQGFGQKTELFKSQLGYYIETY